MWEVTHAPPPLAPSGSNSSRSKPKSNTPATSSSRHKAIERLKKAETKTIPDWFDYSTISGLSREMKEKLTRLRPQTIGQASRLPGVTPAAVALLNVYIEIQSRQRKQT